MTRRRLDKLRLFQDLGYEPHPGQLLVHESKAKRRVVACGVRWGKTMTGTMEVVAGLLEPRGETRGWIVAPALAVAERMLFQVRGVFEKHMPHRILETKGRGHVLRVTNLAGGTATVWAKSTDNPAALLGEGLDFLVVDEACRVRDEIWNEVLLQRLTDRQGWSLALSTPGSGWFHRDFQRGRARRDSAYQSWSAPSWQNPSVDRAWVEAERARLPEDVFRSQYLGEFTGVDADECFECGPALPTNPGNVVLLEGEEPPRCPECNEPVDEDGRTLATRWPNGTRHLQVVRLFPNCRRVAPPPLAEPDAEPDPSLN